MRRSRLSAGAFRMMGTDARFRADAGGAADVRAAGFGVVFAGVRDCAVLADRAAGRFVAARLADGARRVAARLGAFLEAFAAARRLDGRRFRLTAFLAASPLRPLAFRPPAVFLAARPELRRGVRAAFRLAMPRPFADDRPNLDCFR